MRTKLLLSLVVPSLFASVVGLTASVAHADEPLGIATDDESIGTRPAGSQPPQAQPQDLVVPAIGRSVSSDDEDDLHHRYQAPIAVSPAPNWAVMHAGLRPKLGTFGGIATLALAHARTERFYGVFSFSAIRNDAGTTIGAAQVGIGRNLSDTFGGLGQVSVSENRARSFYGGAEIALGYNRALEFRGATQLAAYNRAKEFYGLAQLGAYNRTDVLFAGVGEVGVYNHAQRDFSGLAQVGMMSATGRELFGVGEPGRFAGVTQVGLVSTAGGSFSGLAQIGAGSWTGSEFRGLVQVGALGSYARDFAGLAQVGAVDFTTHSVGIQAGAVAIATKEHSGFQLGGLGNYTERLSGAQVGLANIVESSTGMQVGVANVAQSVKGVQIGLFNSTRNLRGVQIGIANHAEDGVLPWTALLNMGFGPDDSGYAKASSHRLTASND